MKYVIDRLKNMLNNEFLFAKVPNGELRKEDKKAYEISAAMANERIPQLQKAIGLLEAETSDKSALSVVNVIKSVCKKPSDLRCIANNNDICERPTDCKYK